MESTSDTPTMSLFDFVRKQCAFAIPFNLQERQWNSSYFPKQKYGQKASKCGASGMLSSTEMPTTKPKRFSTMHTAHVGRSA